MGVYFADTGYPKQETSLTASQTSRRRFHAPATKGCIAPRFHGGRSASHVGSVTVARPRTSHVGFATVASPSPSHAGSAKVSPGNVKAFMQTKNMPRSGGRADRLTITRTKRYVSFSGLRDMFHFLDYCVGPQRIVILEAHTFRHRQLHDDRRLTTDMRLTKKHNGRAGSEHYVCVTLNM